MFDLSFDFRSFGVMPKTMAFGSHPDGQTKTNKRSKARREISLPSTREYLCCPVSVGRPHARPEITERREEKKKVGEFEREGGHIGKFKGI